MEKRIGSKIIYMRRDVTNIYREHKVPTPKLTQPTWLTPYQMDEKI